jgi:arginyl-tRNA synthetase
MTQELGTAELRYKDFGAERSIYVVGNEQDYHFKVLKLVLQKLGRSYADGLYHLSYGMVDLPSGKMKSREGTVVDADDLVEEMVNTARQQTEELGKIDDFAEGEAELLYHTIGLGALKFYLLRVDPKKRILFDPKESIDLQGYTGPFVQYTYARIRSILRRYEQQFGSVQVPETLNWEQEELEVLKKIYQFPDVLDKAGEELNPAKVVDYAYELAKLYNKFYAEHSIFNAEETVTQKRVALSQFAGNIIRRSFAIVGIQVPERM